LVFPCSGQPAEWPLVQSHIDRLGELYPAVDVPAECRKALAWIEANPTKRKTARGMKRFLNGWMSRCQDRGGSSPAQVASNDTPDSRAERQANINRYRAILADESGAYDEGLKERVRERLKEMGVE
jgi:hypothetical protein